MLLHNSAQFSANGEIQLLCILGAHKYFILGAHKYFILGAHKYFILGAHNIVCFQPQCGPITAVLHYVCCALLCRTTYVHAWVCIVHVQVYNTGADRELMCLTNAFQSAYR